MSELSLYHHWSTLSAIDRAGDRMHAGLMSLATSQAKAMGELGTRIDDRLVQIDQSVLQQNEKLAQIDGALNGLRDDMRSGFIRISEQMSGLDEKLDRIEERVTNPEETRAWERFRRAADLLKKGHPGDALEHLTAAIENDGGPAFRHIPQFHLMLGQIRIGDTDPRAPEFVDYDAAHCAFRQASIYLKGERSAIALCRAGAAAFLGGDLDCAIDTYLDALKIHHPRGYTHFEIAKCYLEKGQMNDMAHHLRHSVDQDWDMLTLVAVDPVFTKHADVVEGVLRKYRDHIIGNIGQGLKAMDSLVSGRFEQDLIAIRAEMNAHAETATLDDLDPDMEATAKPYFRTSTSRSDMETFLEVYDESREISARLAARDVGLTDVSAAFKSMQYVSNQDPLLPKRMTFAEYIQRQIMAAEERCAKIHSDIEMCKYETPDRLVPSALKTGIEATSEASKSATERGGIKPSLVGRLKGQQMARTHKELEDVRRAEGRRMRVKVAEVVAPCIDGVEARLRRSRELLSSIKHAHDLIRDYRYGEMRFLKPSASTQHEGAERGLAQAPS